MNIIMKYRGFLELQLNSSRSDYNQMEMIKRTSTQMKQNANYKYIIILISINNRVVKYQNT